MNSREARPPAGVVCVQAADPAVRERAAELAARLHVPVAEVPPARGELYLRVDASGAGIRRSGSRQNPVRADFLAPRADYRRRFGGGTREPLARATGVTGKRKPSVLDATAGLGRDSFVLAALGCTVTLLERSPVLVALLEDALRRAAADPAVAPVAARMRLVECDALAWLADANRAPVDVIYLDPMFPPRKKSALVKGDMQILHDVVGTDGAVGELLAASLRDPRARVVVKRPRLADAGTARDPDFVITGRSSRFDVYLPVQPPQNG